MFELMDMNIYELIRGRRQYLPEARIKSYMYQERGGIALSFLSSPSAIIPLPLSLSVQGHHFHYPAPAPRCAGG